MQIDFLSLYEIYKLHSDVVTDTRKITSGCLFFALKGERFDGNEFAAQALELGAAYVVVDDPEVVVDNRYLLVVDVLNAMQKISKIHRSHFGFPVIGLTGSNGKTTTKELCAAVLSTQYKVKATYGNLNNHIGVPLTLLSTRLDTELLIVEMGANHQLEIDFLCSIAQPDYTMITNIGKAHLEGFGGVEGIKKGKSEMYRYAKVAEKSIFINTDDGVLVSLLPQDAHLIPYSISDLLGLLSDTPYLVLMYGEQRIYTRLYGVYNLSNIAFAVKLGEYFGVSKANIVKALSDYQPNNNRSERIQIGANTYYKDAYNANPSSMEASLRSFMSLNEPYKIVVLGDMLELGEDTMQEHLEILDLLADADLFHKIYVGQYFYQIKDERYGHFFMNVEAAKVYFDSLDLSDCHILMKGSRGIALEKLLG